MEYKLKNEYLNLYQQKINEKLEDIDGLQNVQTEWNKIKKCNSGGGEIITW
jgi:coproporphyrinogen III oxidase